MKYSCIVWDFNGTILNDVGIGIESINVLLERRGLGQIKDETEYRESFMFPIKKWYEKLGFDFEKESYDDVAVEWVKEYLKREPCACLTDGAKLVLDHFRSLGVKQMIISASESSMLKRQLNWLGIDGYFDEIVGLDNIKAAGKTEIALAWRRKNPEEKLMFIGDTDHDGETAKAIEADCFLISEGHQSFNRLKKNVPEVTVLKKLTDILYVM